MAGAEVGGIDTYPTDVHISYLPLAHVFERIVFHKVLSVGASAGFYRGNPKLLFDDMIVCLRLFLFIIEIIIRLSNIGIETNYLPFCASFMERSLC